ncbi:MAG TPA: DUF4258 domain-containing protein [bacterium]|nr:DUF4258 domain-containing protein [bacterium]
MASYQLSDHAKQMMVERCIEESWVSEVIGRPERTETFPDGTVHFIGAIPEYEGRFLRIIVNPCKNPRKVITLFFDRRLGRKP